MKAAVALLSAVALAIQAGAQSSSVSCQTLRVPVNASAYNEVITAPTPQSQSDVIKTTGLLVALNGAANFSAEYFNGTQQIQDTYYINSRLCVPTSNTAHNSTVLLLIHGINGDISYWSPTFNGSYYNFVEYLGGAGYATLAIDRLGIGQSSKPDGASVVQAALETDIERKLAQGLKSGSLGFNAGGFSKVVAVGHSFGSLLTNLLINQTPDAVDAVVLTGFSHNQTGQVTFNAATQPGIANQVNSTFSSLPNTYLLGSSTYGAELAFFHQGGFDPTLGDIILKSPQTVTVGETVTQGQGVVPAYNFNGPVIIVTGEYDQPFCAGSCYGKYPPIIESESVYYTGSSKFETYVVENSGHFVNYHYQAPNAYRRIISFLENNGL